MNTRLILGILLAASFALPLPARLGETPEECALRYGLRLTPAARTTGFWADEQCYEKNDIRLTIRFIPKSGGGLQAGYIEYRPVDRAGKPLSDVHVKGLLDAVSTNWSLLSHLPQPPAATNNTASSRTTLARTAKTKIITMEKTAGIEDKRLQKEQEARRTQLEAVKKHNLEITRAKNQISKLTLPGPRCWQCDAAYATGGDDRLTILSTNYVSAYTRHAAGEIRRRKSFEATPLKGF